MLSLTSNAWQSSLPVDSDNPRLMIIFKNTTTYKIWKCRKATSRTRDTLQESEERERKTWMNNVNKCNLQRAQARRTTRDINFKCGNTCSQTCRSENRCSAARSMKLFAKKRSLDNGQSSRVHFYHFYYGILTRKAYRQRHYIIFLTICRSETVWLSLRKPVLCCKVNQIHRNKKTLQDRQDPTV